MKTVNEYMQNAANELAEKKKAGKRTVSTFSRRGFAEMMQTMLNDVDYESSTCRVDKDGKMAKETFYPIRDFREKFILPIMLDCNLDKEDAKEKALKYNFGKSQVDSLYPVLSDGVYNYINSGKKFNFIPKEDFSASIAIKEQEECVKEYNTRGGKKTKIKHKACKTLIKKSGTPSWLKDRM